MCSGGVEARAGSVSLSSLVGTGPVFYGGLEFDFDTYTFTPFAPPPAAVSVTFVGAGTGEVGFVLTAPFGALSGEINDANLVYRVKGPNISDALLVGNPAAAAGSSGVASVTETLHTGGIFGPVLGTLFIQNPSPTSASTTFAPTSGYITIIKDIEARGEQGGVSLSSVGQAFSFPPSVPEPTSMALLGIGMTGFLAFRRLFKRTSVA